MISLQLSVHAVLLVDGQLVLRRPEGDAAAPAVCCGDSIGLGETLPAALTRIIHAQLGLSCEAVKLLYIVERFLPRGGAKVHELAHYYLCERRGEAETPLPEGAVLVSPAKIKPTEIEPPVLGEVLAADAADGFQVSPKLLVVNELPEESMAVSGVYRL